MTEKCCQQSTADSNPYSIHITTIFHELGSSGFEWQDAIYKTGAMLIQELCPDTWLDSRYSHIITISHTLSFRKLSIMSSLCSICGGHLKNLTKHIYFETFNKSHDLRSHKQAQHREQIPCQLCDQKTPINFISCAHVVLASTRTRKLFR